MKKDRKTISKAVLSIIMIFCILMLSSCSHVFSDPKNLMKPPKASGELTGIESALNKSIGQNYSYIYPSSGVNRAACMTEDIDNDGKKEAVVLYKSTDTAELHLNLLSQKNERWTSVLDVKLTGTGVDRIDFVDLLDNSNKELLIGCKQYSENENVLTVYSLDDDTLVMRAKENYTNFAVCNLTSSKNPQLMLFGLAENTIKGAAEENSDQTGVQKNATAKLVSFNNSSSDMTVLGGANIDASITSISSIAQCEIKNGSQAVIVDAYKGANTMITEVLCYNGELKNLTMDAYSGENTVTRRHQLVNSRDINDDGIIEIPFTTVVPGYETEISDEQRYYTSWKAFNGKDFVNVSTGLYNSIERYYLKLPASWISAVSVATNSDLSSEDFYEYGKTTGDELLSIKVFEKNAFKNDKNGYVEIISSKNRVFAVKIGSKTSKFAVSEDYVKKNLTSF